MRKSLPFIYLGVNVACALVCLYAGHRVAGRMTLERRTAPDGVDGVTFPALSAPALVIAIIRQPAFALDRACRPTMTRLPPLCALVAAGSPLQQLDPSAPTATARRT